MTCSSFVSIALETICSQSIDLYFGFPTNMTLKPSNLNGFALRPTSSDVHQTYGSSLEDVACQGQGGQTWDVLPVSNDPSVWAGLMRAPSWQVLGVHVHVTDRTGFQVQVQLAFEPCDVLI